MQAAKLWLIDKEGHKSIARVLVGVTDDQIDRAVRDLERFLKTRTDPFQIKVEKKEIENGRA
jgi:hypothetical protein